MKKALCMYCIVAGTALFSQTTVFAESYQALAIQKASLYGETIKVSDADKNHLISQGQEYLRYYLRDEMLRNMANRWLAVDDQSMQTGMKFSLQDFYFQDRPRFQAQMAVYADEDLNKYLDCGYFLPIEVEMDSSYSLASNFMLKAKIEAPFDDVLRFQLGSKIDWNSMVFSTIQYRLSNSSDYYDGFLVGMGMTYQAWRCKLNYELTADMRQIHHFSIARDF